MSRIDGGKIAERWVTWDNIKIFSHSATFRVAKIAGTLDTIGRQSVVPCSPCSYNSEPGGDDTFQELIAMFAARGHKLCRCNSIMVMPSGKSENLDF